MTTIYKTTADIDFSGTVIIQQSMTGVAQFSDAAAVDTKLVSENGIWKYPAQAVGGRIRIPKGGTPARGHMCRLAAFHMACGAATTWSLSIAGMDNTAQRPANASNTPYPTADKLLYLETAVTVASGAGATFVAAAYDHIILLPGQDLILVTAGAATPTARFFFTPVPFRA